MIEEGTKKIKVYRQDCKCGKTIESRSMEELDWNWAVHQRTHQEKLKA